MSWMGRKKDPWIGFFSAFKHVGSYVVCSLGDLASPDESGYQLDRIGSVGGFQVHSR